MTQLFRLNPNVRISPVTDDGCVILDFANDKVLSINKVGAIILQTIASNNCGVTREELIRSIPTINEKKIDALLTKLAERRILNSFGESVNSTKLWMIENTVKSLVNISKISIYTLLKCRLYVLAAWIALALVNAVLKMTGINALRQIISDWQVTGNTLDSNKIEFICSTVTRAGVWYPKQTLCLERSAAITCLLRSIGVPGETVIGVRKMPFYGHAWVEVNGKVVNDDPKVQTFFSRCS